MGEAGLMVPPHSDEAEQSVLGALLIDNMAFDTVADKLVPMLAEPEVGGRLNGGRHFRR